MHTHHLNCGTLRPLGRRRINGTGTPFAAARMVCHCLLIESNRGLVLIDTGFGLDDVRELRQSILRSALSAPFARRGSGAARLERRRRLYVRLGTRARLDPEETAVRQLAALGYSAADVSDVVLTHLDLDHAGGLRDFPLARVHVTALELDAAKAPPTSLERFRYWAHHWSHGPPWHTYPPGGDRWFGFDGVRELADLPDMAFVPLPGHTRGHAGVALRAPRRDDAGSTAEWLLHAGDAYFFHGEVDPARPRSTPGLAAFQARMDADRSARKRTQDELRRLAKRHGDEVEMLCSHDPFEFDRLRDREGQTSRRRSSVEPSRADGSGR